MLADIWSFCYKVFSSPLTTVIVWKREKGKDWGHRWNGLGTGISCFIKFSSTILSTKADDSCLCALDLKQIQST